MRLSSRNAFASVSRIQIHQARDKPAARLRKALVIFKKPTWQGASVRWLPFFRLWPCLRHG